MNDLLRWLDIQRHSVTLNTCVLHGSGHILQRQKGWACVLCHPVIAQEAMESNGGPGE